MISIGRQSLFFGLLITPAVWFALLKPRSVWASTDLTFTCQKHACQLDKPYQPMFDEANIQPGDEFSQKLILVNQSKELGYFYLYLTLASQEDEANLAKTLIVSVDQLISGQPVQVLSPSFLVNLLDQKQSVKLGPVLPGESKVYQVNFQFDVGADNSFQAKFAKFNLNFGLEFLGDPTPKKLARLRVTPAQLVTPILGRSAQKKAGQVLGAQTSTTDELKSSLRATAIRHPWLKRFGPLLAAILAMLSLLGLIFLVWWLWFIISKKRQQS